MKMKKKTAIFCTFGLLAAGPAWSGNGNMLHGFGPINSSMGGSGAGIWLNDPIGTLMFNPALMGGSEGTHVSISTEIFFDDPKFKVELNDGRTGKGNPSTEPGILPALAVTHRSPGSKWGFGFGLVAIAGFRTDNPEDPASFLFALPTENPAGFGRIYTDHRVTKIPLAISYNVNEKLTLGLALNAYIGELAIAPLPYEVIDIGGGVGYYPQGDGLVKSYAISVQPSFYYQATDRISIGGSLTTEQNFDNFEWNSTFANPLIQDGPMQFGRDRKLDYDLDGPMIATLGVGVQVSDKTKVAADVSWLRYDGVSGFGSPGGIVNGVVQPFGWDNVWAFKVGVEHQVSEKITLRGGYNYSDIPIPSKNTLTATGAPAFFQHHISVGAGIKLTEHIIANAGFYYVPKSTSTGPYLQPDGPSIGKVIESNSLLGGQMGLSFDF